MLYLFYNLFFLWLFFLLKIDILLYYLKCFICTDCFDIISNQCCIKNILCLFSLILFLFIFVVWIYWLVPLLCNVSYDHSVYSFVPFIAKASLMNQAATKVWYQVFYQLWFKPLVKVISISLKLGIVHRTWQITSETEKITTVYLN